MFLRTTLNCIKPRDVRDVVGFDDISQTQTLWCLIMPNSSNYVLPKTHMLSLNTTILCQKSPQGIDFVHTQIGMPKIHQQ